MEFINSIKHPAVVEARSLQSAANRKITNKVLLEDEQIIRWALDAGLEMDCVFVLDSKQADPFSAYLLEKQVSCYAVSSGILKKINGKNYTVPWIGVTKLPLKNELISTTQPLILVLDNVLDFGNIGTIIRSASGFGVKDICLTAPESDLYYRKIIEASRGKVFETHFHHFSGPLETIRQLKAEGYEIVATSPHARTLQSEVKLSGRPLALIVGNETNGISEEVEAQADIVVQIPLTGQVESLNVGVAAGISLYEFKLKLVMAMLTKSIRSTLGREVNVASQCIQQAFDHKLAQLSDLNGAQTILLMVMACDRSMSVDEISRTTAMWGEALQKLLSGLLGNAYISIQAEKYRITEKGEEKLGKIWTVIESFENEVLQGFTEEEKTLLFRMLRRVQENCTLMLQQN